MTMVVSKPQKTIALKSGPTTNGNPFRIHQEIRRKPIGSRINTVTFPAQSTSKLRVVFMHRSPSRSGLTEIAVWEK